VELKYLVHVPRKIDLNATFVSASPGIGCSAWQARRSKKSIGSDSSLRKIVLASRMSILLVV